MACSKSPASCYFPHYLQDHSNCGQYLSIVTTSHRALILSLAFCISLQMPGDDIIISVSQIYKLSHRGASRTTLKLIYLGRNGAKIFPTGASQTCTTFLNLIITAKKESLLSEEIDLFQSLKQMIFTN